MRRAMQALRQAIGVGVVLVALLACAQATQEPGVSQSSSVDANRIRWCTTLRERVDALPGEGPVLLRSYDSTSARSLDPSLATAAFSYDNALAVMALIACAMPAQANRIAEGLRRAASARVDGKPQRLRNAYRGGAVEDTPLPNGWWDAGEKRWVEDAYQMGTATGNVAWVALALMAMHEIDDTGIWRTGAERLADWAEHNARDESAAGGYRGGVHGFDIAPQVLGWKSTEHNADLVALFALLIDHGGHARWNGPLNHARRFLDAQWDAGAGHFVIGTLPDGITPNRSTSGLDAQLWPQLLRDAPLDWRRAIAYVERAHGVDGGIDFNDDRDGLWVEGTAQTALVYRIVGRERDAVRLLVTIAGQRSAGGFLHATRELRVTTGLAIGPASATDDFYYFRQPHLGATAWAVLAASGWNPFVLHTIDKPYDIQKPKANSNDALR
ncbi:MAG: hypothetical protein ABI650_03010 [Dokdonella sp.]